MPRNGQIKFPFVLRTLEERLKLEEKYLDTFKRHRDECPEWGDANIESCNHRMKELQEGIELLKNQTYTE